jgi:hypothetical protein
VAKKDKKKWLQLFYTRWGYRPVADIQKGKRYGGSVSLSETLMMASDYNNHVLIHLIFPFANRFPMSKDPKDCVTVFPQAVSTPDGIYENKKPILWGGNFYSVEGFISKCPNITYNAEGLFGTYSFSLEYFMLSVAEINDFRRLYWTPLRAKIIETGIYSEMRGKGEKRTKEEIERKDFIIKEFKQLKKKKPYPIEIIQDKWVEFLGDKYPDDRAKVDELTPNDITVRRILDSYMKK